MKLARRENGFRGNRGAAVELQKGQELGGQQQAQADALERSDDPVLQGMNGGVAIPLDPDKLSIPAVKKSLDRNADPRKQEERKR